MVPVKTDIHTKVTTDHTHTDAALETKMPITAVGKGSFLVLIFFQ